MTAGSPGGLVIVTAIIPSVMNHLRLRSPSQEGKLEHELMTRYVLVGSVTCQTDDKLSVPQKGRGITKSRVMKPSAIRALSRADDSIPYP